MRRLREASPRRKVGPPARNLVFTSAGDRSNISRWLTGRRNFDLWISYYGDEPGRYADVADFYNARRDAKFGNLKFVYDTWPDLLASYDSVLVTDDDVVISGAQMSRLFDLRDELDLWLLQPAFSPLGKISWDITRAQWGCRLRFTNFVETTCPLFRKDKLDAFMRVFDPVLFGIGTDWWFMDSLGKDKDIDGKVAIVDAITCINPWDRSKGGVREFDRLQSQSDSELVWDMVRAKYGVDRRPLRQFGRISKRAPARWLSPIAHWLIDLYAQTLMSASLTKRAFMTRLRHPNPAPD
jgi:hypothetical protein